MDTGDRWRCSRCGAIFVAAEKPSRSLFCLECRRERGRAHYRANREYYIRKAMARNRSTTASVRMWLLEYLTSHPRVDCGNDDVRVLEFDHRDPQLKRAEIAVLTTNGFSLRTVQAEVDKCDVRCANGHLIRTREQQGWWRGRERARHDSNVQPFDP
jgi:hypothetical protein